MVNGYFYSGEDATACQGPPMRNNSLFKYKRSEESLHCSRETVIEGVKMKCRGGMLELGNRSLISLEKIVHVVKYATFSLA